MYSDNYLWQKVEVLCNESQFSDMVNKREKFGHYERLIGKSGAFLRNQNASTLKKLLAIIISPELMTSYVCSMGRISLGEREKWDFGVS